MMASEMMAALAKYITEHGDGEVYMEYDTPNWFSVEGYGGEQLQPDPGPYFKLGENVHGGNL